MSKQQPSWPEIMAQRAREEAGEAPSEGGAKMDATSALACPTCWVELEENDRIELRHGGSSGAAGLLFGNFAELGEGVMPLRFYSCPRCRVVTFRLPE